MNEIAASVVSLYAEEPVTSPYYGLFHDMVEMMIEVNAEVEAIEADEAAAAEGDSPYPPPMPPKKEKMPSGTESDSPMKHPADKIDDSQGGLSDGKNPDCPLRDERNSGSAAGAAEQSSGSASGGDRRNRYSGQPQLVPVSQLRSWEEAPEPLRSFLQAMRESLRETHGYTSDSD